MRLRLSSGTDDPGRARANAGAGWSCRPSGRPSSTPRPRLRDRGSPSPPRLLPSFVHAFHGAHLPLFPLGAGRPRLVEAGSALHFGNARSSGETSHGTRSTREPTGRGPAFRARVLTLVASAAYARAASGHALLRDRLDSRATRDGVAFPHRPREGQRLRPRRRVPGDRRPGAALPGRGLRGLRRGQGDLHERRRLAGPPGAELCADEGPRRRPRLRGGRHQRDATRRRRPRSDPARLDRGRVRGGDHREHRRAPHGRSGPEADRRLLREDPHGDRSPPGVSLWPGAGRRGAKGSSWATTWPTRRAGPRCARAAPSPPPTSSSCASLGRTVVYVAEPGRGDVDEDVAARRVAEAAGGSALRLVGPGAGRANLVATALGLLRVDTARLARINEGEGITIATAERDQPVREGQVVATIKVIPFARARGRGRGPPKARRARAAPCCASIRSLAARSRSSSRVRPRRNPGWSMPSPRRCGRGSRPSARPRRGELRAARRRGGRSRAWPRPSRGRPPTEPV